MKARDQNKKAIEKCFAGGFKLTNVAVMSDHLLVHCSCVAHSVTHSTRDSLCPVIGASGFDKMLPAVDRQLTEKLQLKKLQ